MKKIRLKKLKRYKRIKKRRIKQIGKQRKKDKRVRKNDILWQDRDYVFSDWSKIIKTL